MAALDMNPGNRGGIRIEGLGNTLKALRLLEPEVYKEVRVAVQKAAKATAAGAKAIRPPASFKTSFRSAGNFPGGTIEYASPGGNAWATPQGRSIIFEFALFGKTPQALGAIQSFEERYGQPGRFLWKAWDAQEDTYLNDVTAATEKAAAAIQRQIDTVGD